MRPAFLAHARSAQFQRRVEHALELLGMALMAPGMRYYVAFSTGKDSAVAYDLARRIQPDILGIWSDDEFWLPESAEYFDRMLDTGANLVSIRTRATHTEWFRAHPDAPWASIPEYARAHKYGGCILGVRAQESSLRRMYLRMRWQYFGCLKYRQVQVYPVAWWSWIDVWAYIYSRGLDYNRAYDRLLEIGVPYDRQRIGPVATEGAITKGQLPILRKGWPEVWQKFVEKHPEARQFT